MLCVCSWPKWRETRQRQLCFGITVFAPAGATPAPMAAEEGASSSLCRGQGSSRGCVTLPAALSHLPHLLHITP